MESIDFKKYFQKLRSYGREENMTFLSHVSKYLATAFQCKLQAIKLASAEIYRSFPFVTFTL